MIHLIKDCQDDGTEMWCPCPGYNYKTEATFELGKATCPECLRALVEYGTEAARRLADVEAWDKVTGGQSEPVPEVPALPCGKCYGRGWYPETVPGTEDDYIPDYNERYCICGAGKALRSRE